MGIIGTIDQEMLTKGRDSHKYFTKNRMLYERNQVRRTPETPVALDVEGYAANKNIFWITLFAGKQQVGVSDT